MKKVCLFDNDISRSAKSLTCIFGKYRSGQKKKDLEEQGKDIPTYLVLPTIKELEKLQIAPDEDKTEEETRKRNYALAFIVENVLQGAREGARNWREDRSSKLLSDMNVTPLDMAFAVLSYQNMIVKWKKGIRQATLSAESTP
jgi:hypothetical protein